MSYSEENGQVVNDRDDDICAYCGFLRKEHEENYFAACEEFEEMPA